jgi:hypothetical protein
MHILSRLFTFSAVISGLLYSFSVQSVPLFARQYNVSCTTCHSAFPRLNAYGKEFVANNYRMPHWKDSTLDSGDDQLALPAYMPLAVRAQAFAQGREAEAVDVVSGESTEADNDFQAPYLIKLLSSAPLSDHITFYFYAILAEKGGNGLTLVEDAWFAHDDLFGSEVSMMLGQFQVSDLMFPRETRLTFQDFMPYRMAGITYDRGMIFGREVAGIDLSLGFVNGNGITDNYTINSPGYQRSDHLFDNDNNKAAFMRLGADMGPVAGGLFAYAGEQKNATGLAGIDSGDRDTDKQIAGLDLSGKIGGRTWWFSQFLWNEWDGFIDPNTRYQWFGMFLGVDYISDGRWSYSALYNYADGEDFDATDTIYEGIDISSLTLNASYYFMRNIKGVIEVNYDFLDEETQTGSFYTGHLTSEGYLLFGFDAAF